MKKVPLFAVVVGLVASTLVFAGAPAEPVPSRYLSGPVSRDASGALKRGISEHKPVWIIAWDESYFRTAEGRKMDKTDYDLAGYYGNPESKRLISSSCIQVFTSLKNPAIAQWVDASDISHTACFFVVNSNGVLVAHGHSAANQDNGLQDIQKIIGALK